MKMNSEFIEKIMKKYLIFEENIADLMIRKVEARSALRSLNGSDLSRAVDSIGSRENYIEFITSEFKEYFVEGAIQQT